MTTADVALAIASHTTTLLVNVIGPLVPCTTTTVVDVMGTAATPTGEESMVESGVVVGVNGVVDAVPGRFVRAEVVTIENGRLVVELFSCRLNNLLICSVC